MMVVFCLIESLFGRQETATRTVLVVLGATRDVTTQHHNQYTEKGENATPRM